MAEPVENIWSESGSNTSNYEMAVFIAFIPIFLAFSSVNGANRDPVFCTSSGSQWLRRGRATGEGLDHRRSRYQTFYFFYFRSEPRSNTSNRETAVSIAFILKFLAFSSVNGANHDPGFCISSRSTWLRRGKATGEGLWLSISETLSWHPLLVSYFGCH